MNPKKLRTPHSALRILLALLAFSLQPAFPASPPIYGVRVDTNGNLTAPANFFTQNASNIAAALNVGGALIDSNSFDSATLALLSSNNFLMPTNSSTNSFSGTNTFSGPLAGTGVSNAINTRGLQIKQFSAVGGGNELIDMFAASNQFDAQLGIAESSPSVCALYVSQGGPGVGTNVWGYPLDLLGGMVNLGNPYWYDMPFSANLRSMQVSWAAGPTASRITSAYVGGNTNGSTIQPGFNIVDYNPFSGAGGILIRGAFTNASHGQLVGTNADGVKIYVPQFGLQLLQIGDAYNAIRSNANNTGAEAQQSPSQNLLMNDTSLVFYHTINTTRAGDTNSGQAPLVVVDPRAHFLYRIPIQVANVWAVTNTGWLDLIIADETTGVLLVTNGPSYFTNLNIQAGSQFLYTGPSGDNLHGFDVNTNSSFNSLAGQVGIWTWDNSAAHRLGIWTKPSQFAKIAHGSGTPLTITMNTSGSDLQANASGTQFDEVTIDAAHNVNVVGGMLAVTNANGSVGLLATNAAPTFGQVGGNGCFRIWCSNSVPYITIGSNNAALTLRLSGTQN